MPAVGKHHAQDLGEHDQQRQDTKEDRQPHKDPRSEVARRADQLHLIYIVVSQIGLPPGCHDIVGCVEHTVRPLSL